MVHSRLRTGPLVPKSLTVWIALIVVSVAAAVLVHPVVGFAFGVIGWTVVAFPFDPLVGLLWTVAAASFANYEGGRLTQNLSLVSLLGLYTIASTIVLSTQDGWRLPRTRLLVPLLLLGVSTFASAAHGVLAGNPLRFLFLELLPILVLGLSLVAGGLELDDTDLRRAFVFLSGVALIHVALGVYSYEVNQGRTGGIWYTPIPGMFSLVSLNAAFRERSRARRAALVALTGLCLLHQLISFARGYWLGLIVAIPFTCLAYGRRGEGAPARWADIGRVLALAVGGMLVATVVIGAWFGWGDLLSLIFTRFSSSFGSTPSSETASNFARVVEYVAAAKYIVAAPWFGHGLGFEMRVKQPLLELTTHQWYMHHSYLLLWVKQGIFGLVAMLAVLWAGFRTGLAVGREADSWKSIWGSGAAAATIYLAVTNATTFHMAQVNSTTLQGLLWGIAIASQRPDSIAFVWRRARSEAA